MSDLKPGWADALGQQLRELGQTEEERCKGTGMKPRKVWRDHSDSSQASRLRGARAPKKPLPPLFREDEAKEEP